MSLTLKKVVISRSGDTICRTRSEVPDYIRRAISDSLERGRHDARQNVFVADRREPRQTSTGE